MLGVISPESVLIHLCFCNDINLMLLKMSGFPIGWHTRLLTCQQQILQL